MKSLRQIFNVKWIVLLIVCLLYISCEHRGNEKKHVQTLQSLKLVLYKDETSEIQKINYIKDYFENNQDKSIEVIGILQDKTIFKVAYLWGRITLFIDVIVKGGIEPTSVKPANPSDTIILDVLEYKRSTNSILAARISNYVLSPDYRTVSTVLTVLSYLNVKDFNQHIRNINFKRFKEPGPYNGIEEDAFRLGITFDGKK